MKTSLDCIPCFVKQALLASRQVTDDENIQRRVMQAVTDNISTMDLNNSPPKLAMITYRTIREVTGIEDALKDIKQKSNEYMLKHYTRFSQIAASNADPFTTALKLSIAGNIIDMAFLGDLSELDIFKTIDEALASPLKQGVIDAIQSRLQSAKEILYLTDNAGEIVFDKLFLEYLDTSKITVAVKGGPIINDATMTDAEQIGLTSRVKVMHNGSDGAGTLLDTCSREFVDKFNSADFIISKGQANFETLEGVRGNILFLLKAKCPVVATYLGVELGSIVAQLT